MGATGYVLTIPKDVLDKLEKADAKINHIAESSEKTEVRFKNAFHKMANYVDPLLNKLEALKGLGNLRLDKTFKSSATDAEKAASGIAQVATQLNKVAESPVDIVNKKLESMRKLMEETKSASERLATATSKGVISRDVLSGGNTASALMPEIQGQIRVLELERAELQQNDRYWKQYIENLNGSSIAAQKQKAEMDKLNSSFRDGQSIMQKQAKAEDELGKAAQKVVTALDKAAQAEQRKANARSNAANAAAVRAEEQYARALNKSEVTIVQRARKIEALANAQRALTQTGKQYTTELAKITSETQRLQKANDEAAKSMTKLKSNQSSVLNITDQLTRKFALLFSVAAIQGYIEKLVTVRGEFELQQRALQAILQNKDEANALWEKTVALAVKSPFQVKELVTYTKQLAAYRIESDKLYDTTKMLADVSAGLGVDMGRLILAYGQVKAANYLRASEVRQFTEAGVNILGELADIYTELEGRMVSVGEVQDRITRRMVEFGDIEEVFKRITSAGGIFYNMQEIQAETLAGMISNLKDNFDVMFNDIGKANDGVLKGFINILNDIVANWRILSNVLSAAGVGFVLYAAKVTIATIANKGFAKSSIEATIAQKGLVGTIGKVVNSFQGLGAFLKGNLWIVLASAIAGAGYALYDNYKKVEEAKQKYDALNGTLNTQKEKLEELITKYESSLNTQKDLNEELKSLKKGSDEYNSVQKKLNDSKKEESKILGELQLKYPEIYSSISNQKNAVKSLREEQAKYNKELEATKLLNYQIKQSEPYFGKGFKETIDSYSNSLVDQSNAADKLKYSYMSLEDELRMYMSTSNKLSDDAKSKILAILDSTIPLEEKALELDRTLRNMGDRISNIGEIKKPFKDLISSVKEYKDAIEESVESTNDVNAKFDDVIKKALAHEGVTVKTFNNLDKEQKKQLEKTLRTFIRSVSDNESVLKGFQERVKKTLNFDINLEVEKPQKRFSEAQKALNDAIEKFNNSHKESFKLQAIEPEENLNDFVDKIYKSGEAWDEVSKRNAKSIQNLNPEIDKVKANVVSFTNSAATDLKALAESFGYFSKKGEKAGETEYERRLKAQLELLKKMQSQYEKLRQTMGDKEATETITKEFGKAYTDLFKKPLTLKFDKASIANEMEVIAGTIGGKSAEALKRSWYSTIGQSRSEISVSATIENMEAFEREMDSMFNSYQLYIELEAKGLPKDVISNLFGIDVTTLDDIKKAIETKYPDISALGEKELDSYFKLQKKITDNEKKELQRRSNLLAEYLQQSVDKVKQVQNSGALEISFATDFFNKGKLDAEQYATIIKNVTDKVNKEVSRLNMEKFKETPEYIQAIGDLSAYSATQLEQMIARMQEFINNSAGNLNASDLKVYTDLIDKMQERLKNVKSPINKNAFSEYRQLVKLQREFNAETERYNQLLREQKIAEENLKAAKARLQEVQDNPNIRVDASAKDDLAAAQEELSLANDTLNSSNNQLNISQGKLSNISGKMGQIQGGLSTAMSMVDRIVTGIYQSINATIDLMNQFKDLAESQGVDVNKGGWREAAQAGELLGNVNEKVMSSWNNFKSGNIAGAVADAVGSITSIFTTLNKQHDARREQAIQEEIKQVEKLQKAYERLGDDISNAYTIDTLNASNENAQRNIQQQIQSYQNMIAAEEDKKDTDWDRIDKWKEAITDLQEQAADLQNQKIADLGGFGSGADMKSAAEEFASAWMDAYRETGDGLDALTDKWDEYINNIIMKQMALRGMEKFLKPVMDLIDESLKDAYLDTDEQKAIDEAIEKSQKGLNDFWKKIAESFNIPIGDEGGSDNASTLSKGIQGVTEETANVIEAYLNSMRYFVADSNMILNNLYAAFISTDPLLNPMFSELSNQTKLLRSIDDRLSSVITYSGDHPNGGAALKTII